MALSAVPRRLAVRAARSGPFARVVDVLERLDAEGAGLLPVLMYHRVAPPDERRDLDPSLLSAAPPAFEEQVAFLAEQRRALSLPELLAIRAGEAELPQRAVLVTFDDAYRDFGEHAWPILRRHAVPVTLFVPTGYPDSPSRAFWWDRLHAALASADGGEHDLGGERVSLGTDAERLATGLRLRARVKALPHAAAMELVDDVCARLGAAPLPPAVLPWDELRRLAEEGVALAPHTRTHPLLDRVPVAQAREEIAASADDLRRELGDSPPAFAYPAGGYDDGVVRVLAEEGFLLGFTIDRGTNDLRHPDWLRLKRVNVGRRASLPLLRAQLLPIVARARRPAGATG